MTLQEALREYLASTGHKGGSMTLQQAMTIAEQAKPKHEHRQPLDKLQGSTAAGQFATDAAALSKRFDGMADTASSLQKRLDQIAADVEYIENFKPGSPPRNLQ